MSALGHKRTSLWKQLVRKTLHVAGHRCLDRGEIAPGRAWLGRDHLGPNNEEGRDRDEDNGQLLAHCSRFPLPAGLLGHRTRWGDVTVLASLAGAGASLRDVVHTDSFFIEFLRSRRSQAAALLVRSHMRLEGLGC